MDHYTELYHHGIKGQKWGVRRYQNEDGTLTPEGKSRYAKRKVFISGSSKTQTEDSPYYRKELPKAITDQIDEMLSQKASIIVGDAPGIDRQVQDYLKSKNYKDVNVYGPGNALRYIADDSWKAHPIPAPEFEEGSKEWLAKKDKAMQDASTEGLAVVLENGGAGATRKNVETLISQNKNVKVYELKSNIDEDNWSEEYAKNKLQHHGIKGQQWGVKHGPPYPIDAETHKTIVKKGTKINRLTRRDETKEKGHAYVTYRKEDTTRYEGFFATILRNKNGLFGYNDPIWSLKYSAAEDLVSPSKKERIDTFIELLDNDPEFIESITKIKRKQNKILDNKDTYGFEKFASSLGGNKYGQQKYFEALKNKGYNYVIDDDDAGRNGHEPAIILDRNKSLNYEGKEQLTNKRINETRRKYGNRI